MNDYFDKLKRSSNILVVGDVMVDIYYYGAINRISPEAPVPVFKYKSRELRLGGASNVANNLAHLGQSVYLMGCVGDDETGKELIDELKKNGISTEAIEIDSTRPTIQKIRYIAENNQQILRMDIEEVKDIEESIQNKLLRYLEANIRKFDLVIISDYLKGMLPFDFTQKIIEICNNNDKRVLVDPKDKNAFKYENAYLIKPNIKEFSELSGKAPSSEEELNKMLQNLKEKLNVKSIIVTRGSKGMIYINRDNNIFNLPTEAKEVYDVTGAGDTVMAYIALCLSSGVENIEAVRIANAAAGVKVRKMGTSVVKLNEVYSEFKNDDNATKILSIDKMAELSKKLKLENKKIVFTNGCFDILHSGHITYLKDARNLGDLLIVGVNSDASVKRLKGNNRPIINQENRTLLLAALECVDYIVVFDEDTPYNVIEKIVPHILVKGGDYKKEDVVGKDIVEKNGGEVTILPYIKGESTTNIIDKILKVYSV